ncbi:kinase-like domain-containing protein [Immersiella caudata]|uniref:non-specific serine/threonine protein kinase n=1 Tax=Immersiella caudata TaxID=314043 RepID=A0AA39WVX6_9PEZI|nr:kinase-like domain-containing protein [Immersiella caudata]
MPIRDFRLETSLSGGVTRHSFPNSNAANGAKPDEIWKRARLLARRPEGLVWAETCIGGHRKGESRAVKSIAKRIGSQYVDFRQELEALSLFSQPPYVDSFVGYYGWFEDNDTIYVAMEHLELGDLSRFMRRPFSEGEACHLLSQVVRGVAFMHARNFSHRDLKPQNILVRQSHPRWVVKIADFGISKRITDTTHLRTETGTRHYMAPEIMGIFTIEDLTVEPPKDGAYSLVVDVWSLGVLAFQLLTNSLPFPTVRTLSSYVHLGMANPATILSPFQLSGPCIEFITSTLAPSPRLRPAASELDAHPWLRSGAHDTDIGMTQGPITPGEPLPVPTDIEQAFFLFDITDPSGDWDTVRPAAQAARPPPQLELPHSSPEGTAASIASTATRKPLSTTTGNSTELQTLNTTIGDEEFDFDDMVVNSAAYRKAFAKQVKRMGNDSGAVKPRLEAIRSQDMSKKRSFRNLLFGWRQRRQDSRDGSIFLEPSPSLRSSGLAGGRIERMSALEGHSGDASPRKPNPETSKPGLDAVAEKKAASDSSSSTAIGKLTGLGSQQSEQLPFFKDYYSRDDIHPGDRVGVLWAYQPRAADEFALERGDMLKIVGIWDDGWATGVMMDDRMEEWEARRQAQRDSPESEDKRPPVTGEIKALPLVCVCLPEHWRKTIEGDTGNVSLDPPTASL